ncbi:Neuroglobin [Fasciola gigantica]|uniref:Neuroglobin n=1 Tax=Fasciola gigantica TaxID=46835 RepID=A0A504Z0B8_FASGI|nr:Neuroglobin [Fasciola gigantica]
MGAEQSRLYPEKPRLPRKRLSLPLQLMTTTSSTTVNCGGRVTPKPVSCELSQLTPGSSCSQREGQLVGNETNLNQFFRPETENQFTEFELDVLLSTWPLIDANRLENGWLVFQNAFSIYPELPKFFHFDQLPRDSEEYMERGSRHILAFMGVFVNAIDSLNGGDKERFYERMMLLGARHAAIPGMKTEYFKVFKQAILMTWESLMYEEFTDDVRRAWAHLIDYVIGILNEGCLVFEEEEEKILLETQLSHRASDSQLLPYGSSTRRRSGQPSVVSMTPEELANFYSLCK